MKRFSVLLVAFVLSVGAFAQDSEYSGVHGVSNIISGIAIIDSTGCYWSSTYGSDYYGYTDEWCIDNGDIVSIDVQPFRIAIDKEYVNYYDWNSAYTTVYHQYQNIIQQKQVSVHRIWRLIYVVKDGKIVLDRVIRAKVTPERLVPQHTEPAKVEWPE